MKTQFPSRRRNAEVFGLRREAERHAAFENLGPNRKAVSPLRSATALQNFASLRLCAFAFFFLPLWVVAATNDLTSALQKGLFEEEANHNLEAAAQAYRDLSAQFDKDRKVAATAVFRLGEIYRKQGKTNEAVVQYERIVREFSDQETLATLSRRNLASLGRSFQPSATAALSPAARLEQRRLLEAEIKLLETKVKSEKLLLEAGSADIASTIAAQRELLALKRQLVALSLDATPEDIRAEQGRLLDEEINLVEQKLARVRAMATDRESSSVVADTERELLALKRQRIALANEPLLATTSEASAVLVTDEEEKEIRRIQVMIQNSPDLINAPGVNFLTPLCRAASAGWSRVAKFLLDNAAAIDRRSGIPRPGFTPLYYAASGGHKAMVELLLARGADVNARGESGLTPLHSAAANGFQALVEVLLANKADANAITTQQQTPLHQAAGKGHAEVVRSLISKGAKLDARDSSGQTPLLSAAMGGHSETVKALLTAKAKPDIEDNSGRTALSYAAEASHLDSVKALLETKADPDAGKMNLPLHVAIHGKNLQIGEALLDAKADPNRAAKVSWAVRGETPGNTLATPLYLAVNQSNSDAVKLLLKYKADPNREVPNSQPVIFHALSQPEMLKALLEAGADPNAGDDKCNTPLNQATDAAVVEVLLAHGAKTEVNCNGRTPLIFAAENSRKQVVAALLKGGANVSAKDPNGQTALHLAVSRNDADTISLLLAHKADVNPRDNQGRTPLDFTKNNPTLAQIATVLRQHGGLDNLPDLTSIRVTRRSAGVTKPAFVQGTNLLNRFTLLEVIARVPWGNTTGPGPGASPAVVPFPDFSKVTITRLEPKTGKLTESPVDVAALIVSGDCSKDFLLDWGDLIDIPDREHTLNEQWRGLPTDFGKLVAKCLRRKITVEVKSEPQSITLEPLVLDEHRQQALSSGNLISSIVLPFRLKDVLTGRARLFSTSDLTRVKVRRVDPASGQTLEWVFNEEAIDPTNDLWLRDGDVIEVPDKP